MTIAQAIQGIQGQEQRRETASLTSGEGDSSRRLPTATRYLGVALLCSGVVLVAWLFGLARSLPTVAHVQHWSALWAGLDALEALGLVTTGVLLLRRDQRRCLTAAGTAALLVVDAWFDVLTSLPGPQLATALVMALGVELPLATLCGVLAVRSLPGYEAAHFGDRTRTSWPRRPERRVRAQESAS